MNTEQNVSEQTAEAQSQNAPLRGYFRTAMLAFFAFAIILGFFILSGIRNRLEAQTSLKEATQKSAALTVRVVYPKTQAPAQEITLPGNVQAYTETPIYARTNGYLKKWFFDLGAHIKQGDLLAKIETPEVDQQLQQARAELQVAEASLRLAKSTADRWQGLLTKNAVSQQETDEKVGDLGVKEATYASMMSNVRRLENLQSFNSVYAPFDGVITARNTDLGALIDAGANAPGKELYRLAATGKLRVFVNVPQSFASASRTGARTALTVNESPGKEFRGIIVRTAKAIDPASRTLLTEIEVDNPTGELLPGAYVTVRLRLPGRIDAITIPTNALLFRADGVRVGVARNGVANLVPITIGRDFGAEVEVVSGLKPKDAIIENPADSLISGAAVRISDRERE
ncbi:MAG TPA: efflux RND transporter periplasmic adaptor subunit [Blastocatellia bacterium]|jgi:RND family efflux transporter MFP subunit|nr:efflux RND transporter periplasmic adaptor subunit [Blastocatellia bacterium]